MKRPKRKASTIMREHIIELRGEKRLSVRLSSRWREIDFAEKQARSLLWQIVDLEKAERDAAAEVLP